MSGRPSIAGFLRADENEELIQRVMTSEKVSIQVARNLLKAGKLGVGPGAKFFGGAKPAHGDEHRSFGENPRREWEPEHPVGVGRDSRDDGHTGPPPAKFDKKAAAHAMALKLKKIQEEQEEREDELAEQTRKNLRSKKGMIGIGRLGPVSARQEQVDPLKIKVAALEARQAEAEARRDDPDAEEEYAHPQEVANKMAEGARMRAQEELRRDNREARKRERQHRERGAPDHGEPRHEDSDEGHNDKSWRNKRARSQSPDEGGPSSSGGAASSSGGLMSEAQAKAMMKKGKKNEVSRGSASAAARIQRELAEWEGAKAKNPEFWKPPKFCLVLGSGRAQR